MSTSKSRQERGTSGAGSTWTLPAGDATQGSAHLRWLAAARVGVAAVWVLSLLLFAAGISSALFREQTSVNAAVLRELGLSTGFWAVYQVTCDSLVTLGYLALVPILIWRRSDDWMAVFIALMFALFGTTAHFDVQRLPPIDPLRHALTWVVGYAGPMLIFLFFYLFPDGRFVPRWARVPFAVVTAATAAASFFPDSMIGLNHWPSWLRTVVWMGSWAAGLSAQIYRYLRVSTPLQRQQTKWVVYGLAVAILGTLAVVAPALPFPALNQPGPVGLLAVLIARPILAALKLLVPASIGISILRYRLWDIDILINRTLVFGALTASVVGIYVLVVGGIGALLQAQGNLAISLVATGLVAVLFQPLRERLQRGMNRFMYGERDEPYAVIARLGQRLEGTLQPDAVLPTIVGTVREALKLPYAAIALGQDRGLAIAASAGLPGDAPLHLPLVYQHETVGELLISPRARDEPFSRADRRLLDDLARQAGVAAHAVCLTAELQRSRERLVTAREEERRRLRRDLHDGLGPSLAAQTLKVGSARALLAHNPAAAGALLDQLEDDIEAALQDVRRLVYDLRPPALDELGLAGALRERAAHYAGETGQGLRVVIETPEELPALPAAVEVAAYRIVQEALANVVRHAHASTCSVRLAMEGAALIITVTDDGRGLPAERHVGLGLHSMRERTEELGGTCQVEALPAGGTRVLAHLPLPSG